MPHTSARRPYETFGRKMSKRLMCGKAKRLFGEIIRDISAVESRILRQKSARA